MVLISLLLRRFLIDKPLNVRMIPFQVLSVFLVLIEIGKQVLSLIEGYQLYYLPFHYCSLFIFVFPLQAIYNGKHKNVIGDFSVAISATVVALMLAYPELIYSSFHIKRYFTDYISFHTVTYHNIIIFELFLIFALNIHSPKFKRSLKHIIFILVAFLVLSAIMAYTLKTNYANLYVSTITPISAIWGKVRELIGVIPAQVIYVILMISTKIIATTAIFFIVTLFKNKLTCLKHFQD